jgi:hypothetical protein
MPEDEGEYLPTVSLFVLRTWRLPDPDASDHVERRRPEGLEPIGRLQIANLERHVGLAIGCGIGRAALQLLDIIDERRRSTASMSRDAITRCRHNVAMRHPNCYFRHFEVFQ